jgi:high-affinity nickel-transport protein
VRGRRLNLDAAQWRTLAAMATVVLGLHAVGFFLLFAVVAPHHLHTGTGVFAVGTGLTAYTLGLRHAFDADHIAAIDNTTRKLMAEGKRPMSVGLFFSLGHATIVLVLALLFSAGVRAFGPHGHSGLAAVGGWIGPAVSGTFLYLIAAVNLAILWGILRLFAGLRRGRYDEGELEARLASRGLMNRLLAPAARAVRAPWHMYPGGLLFGLGFDTATEVGLLFLAVGAAGAGLPVYAILCLPILFAAGMSLLDTIDGSFMNFAYGWAFSEPVRKLFYNLTITGLSVLVALVIGTIEIVGLLASKAGAHGAVWAWFESIDINALGVIIVGLFLATWLVAVGVWRLGRFEQRWNSALPGGHGSAGAPRAGGE